MPPDALPMELAIWIDASPADVFDSWVRADALSRWFQHGATSTDAAGAAMPVASSGARYEWTMVHGRVSRGEYLDVQPPDLVRLTFGEEPPMSFTVRCEPRDGGTLVRLAHEGVPADDAEMYADIRAGWTFFLANLKAWHEHGVDLREHRADRIRGGVLNI